jgi:hypothetical protein
MAKPAITEGGVLPQGIHEMTRNDVRALFGDQGHRAELWSKFDGFLLRLTNTAAIPLSIYLDGSFITAWESCRDIDVILEARDFERGHIETLKMLVDSQVKREFLDDFGVMLHIYVPGLKSRDLKWFQRVKPEEAWRFGNEISRLKKGIVRLSL